MKMTQLLVDPLVVAALRDALGYRTNDKRCETCRHFKVIDDTHVDRMTLDVCTFPNIGRFRVDKRSACAAWEPVVPSNPANTSNDPD